MFKNILIAVLPLVLTVLIAVLLLWLNILMIAAYIDTEPKNCPSKHDAMRSAIELVISDRSIHEPAPMKVKPILLRENM